MECRAVCCLSLSLLKFTNQLTDFYKLGMNIMTVGSSSLTSYFNFRTDDVKNMAGASVFSESPQTMSGRSSRNRRSCERLECKIAAWRPCTAFCSRILLVQQSKRHLRAVCYRPSSI